MSLDDTSIPPRDPNAHPDSAETWAPVAGTDGQYYISNRGRVRSETRVVRTRYGVRTVHGRMLRLIDATNGYRVVMLSVRGVKVIRSVHRMVAAAFLGLRDEQIVNHLDGDRHNNHTYNLECTNHSGNELHARRILGKRCNARLNEELVASLRRRYHAGETNCSAMARELRVDPKVVSDAICGRTYADLPGAIEAGRIRIRKTGRTVYELRP